MRQTETLRSTALAEPENDASSSTTHSANAISMAGVGGRWHDEPDRNVEGNQEDPQEEGQLEAFAAPPLHRQTRSSFDWFMFFEEEAEPPGLI